MKYEYGVEYKTNGEKPDLPDDVKVFAIGAIDRGEGQVGGLLWSNVESFRIVDERYKPKEQDMNDWYEKGELPPVGSVVSFHRSDKYKDSLFTKQWCEGDHLEVLAHKKGEAEDVAVVWNQRLNTACGIVIGCLKPIRTERDVLVEKAIEVVPAYTNETADSARLYTIGALIDAGWRPIKQQSEDEFVSEFYQLKSDGDETPNMGRFMYRAGCRFIEQVKV